MSKLTKTVLERPVATFVILIALIVFGVNSITGLSMQLIPEINLPMMVEQQFIHKQGQKRLRVLLRNQLKRHVDQLQI